MATKTTKIKPRIFNRSDSPWFFGDFRGKPLFGKRENLGTDNRKEAEEKYLVRFAELEEAARSAAKQKEREAEVQARQELVRAELGIKQTARIDHFAARHLDLKAISGRFTKEWLDNTTQRLQVAVGFFGAETELHRIKASDAQRFAVWLAQQPVRRGNPSKKRVDPSKKNGAKKRAPRTISAQTQRHYLNALSNLYQRAQAEEVVPLGHNPVALLLEKPTARRQEAKWLEAHDAALLLESARLYKPAREEIAMPFAYPLLATFLLTGGRTSEVLGIEVGDLNFDRETVTFRPNDHRRLKTGTSARVVPMWPQLQEILRAYIDSGLAPKAGLLFPSPLSVLRCKRCGKKVPSPTLSAENRETCSCPTGSLTEPEMVTDVRKMLDAIGERAGWKPGEIRSKMFRHTYCAARLQTTDRGEAVSQFTVSREMGHGGDSLVKRVYGHLGSVRHRSEHVEFLVDQHKNALAERLPKLRAVA